MIAQLALQVPFHSLSDPFLVFKICNTFDSMTDIYAVASIPREYCIHKTGVVSQG